jgi:Na+/melibiose symporter-like transporter
MPGTITHGYAAHMEEETSTQQKTFYASGQLANGVYNFLNNLLVTWAAPFTSNNYLLTYLGNTRTIEGVVIQPLVGRWSDRTKSPLGRRRPFILVGIPLSVLFLCAIPLAGHAPKLWALPLIFTAVVLFSIFWNVAGDPYQALMVDITPEEQRPRYNSILAVLALLGQVGLGLYAIKLSHHNDIPDTLFYAAGGFMLLMFALVFFGVREPKDASRSARVEERIPFRTYIEDLRRFKEAFKLLLSILFFWTALNPVQSYLIQMPKKLVGASTPQAIAVYLTLIMAAAVAAYPFGKLGAKYGSRRFIVLGMLLLIAASIVGLLVRTYFMFFPLAILAGVGFSATTVLTFPYLSTLVPPSKIGVFTGLQTTFSAMAVPFSVIGAGTLITHFGIRTLFIMLALCMVADVIFLLRIDEGAARKQLEDVEREEQLIAAAAAT